MKSYWEFVDLMYSPCIYFLYIFHVLYFIEFVLIYYIKRKYSFATKFAYYAYQQDLAMYRFVVLRSLVWIILLILDSSSQRQNAVASTCEPSFTGSILLLLSIGYCIKTILSAKKSDT